MRLIDKDALMKTLDIKDDCGDCEYENGFFCSRNSDFVNACEAICDAPTIAEFEGDSNKVIVKGEEYHRVVRCKNCKYMTEHYDTDGNVPYWTCSEWDSGTDYDGFCHLAERRSDDGV